MKIFIPSKSRHKEQITLSFMPDDIKANTTLVIDASEEEDYAKVHDNLLIVPEEIKGISGVRQYIWDNSDDPRIVMLDDDLRFYVRKSPTDWHLRYLEPEEYHGVFGLLDEWMDQGYGHCGISAREGNNRVKDLSTENTRYIRTLAYDLDICRDKVEHGRVTVMEDFDVALQLLRAGVPNKVSFFYAQGQKQSNAAGGCSTYRSPEVQAESALKMKELHEDFVRVVEKETKTAWGWGKRQDVVISWKKAYASYQG
jgi:glycosyltransferase involved in cell wall biosynthesis